MRSYIIYTYDVLKVFDLSTIAREMIIRKYHVYTLHPMFASQNYKFCRFKFELYIYMFREPG